VLSRARQLDKALVVRRARWLYGLATLYSAGQTDVATFVATIWHRQLIWLGLGIIVVWLTFRTSPRMLEWATPFAYALAVLLLLLTLVVGTGAGTAAGSKSWLTIAGHRFGQPAELAKLAVILMLARWLAGLREAPSTLGDLIPPAAIAALPCVLVLQQPDLGSAIIFVAILFFMLFWAGTKPSLLLLAASPVIGLALAFSTVAWGIWIAVLALLLLWWRPYLWEGLAVMVSTSSGASWRCPVEPSGALPAKPPARISEPRCRPPCSRMARHPIKGRGRIGWSAGEGFHRRHPKATRLSPGPAYRLHLLDRG
jgi:cell division protein FtsW (lipid II flippase)